MTNEEILNKAAEGKLIHKIAFKISETQRKKLDKLKDTHGKDISDADLGRAVFDIAFNALGLDNE